MRGARCMALPPAADLWSVAFGRTMGTVLRHLRGERHAELAPAVLTGPPRPFPRCRREGRAHVKLAGLVGLIGVLLIAYAQLFALWDALARQPEVSFPLRLAWLFALLAFPGLATIAYLRMGPGAAHWPPWDIDED